MIIFDILLIAGKKNLKLASHFEKNFSNFGLLQFIMIYYEVKASSFVTIYHNDNISLTDRNKTIIYCTADGRPFLNKTWVFPILN